MKLAEATVIAIQAAPKGVKPVVKPAGGFFHVTLASDDKTGTVSTTVDQNASVEWLTSVCASAAKSFSSLPTAKAKNTD